MIGRNPIRSFWKPLAVLLALWAVWIAYQIWIDDRIPIIAVRLTGPPRQTKVVRADTFALAIACYDSERMDWWILPVISPEEFPSYSGEKTLDGYAPAQRLSAGRTYRFTSTDGVQVTLSIWKSDSSRADVSVSGSFGNHNSFAYESRGEVIY